MKQGLWLDIATATGFPLDERQLDLLVQYRVWLLTEAIPAGGVGPQEGARVSDRHIGDSLLFSWPFRNAPTSVLDLGSGVGLPGIPLAILWPSTVVILLDRSGKRVDLARRAARVLGLDNVEVLKEDLEVTKISSGVVVTRAVSPPERLLPHVSRLVKPGGMAVAGGSWRQPPQVKGWETVEISLKMLDRPVWLLIMRRA